MKISTTLFLFGMVGTALGGCKMPTYGDSSCSGYLGCSADKGQIGIAPEATMCSGELGPPHAINLGCGHELPPNQVQTSPGLPKGYTHFTLKGTGATLAADIPSKAGPRTFWVRVPVDYDKNKKYRVVYIGQGCGGYGVANVSTLQLFKEKSGGTEQAIYVALDIPTEMANMDCYDNRDGPSSQEWEAFQLFQNYVDNNYCVDNNRVYVSGYSTGGWLTNMWGCYFAGDGLHPWRGVVGGAASMSMSGIDAGAPLTSRAGNATDAAIGDAAMSDAPAPMSDAAMSEVAPPPPTDADSSGQGTTEAGMVKEMTCTGPRKFAPEYHIRAQAGVSGGEPDNNPACNGPVAAIWIHDLMDSNAYSANHEAALSRVLKMNGCSSKNPPTAPWHEEVTAIGKGVCVKYTDCPAAYPVVFCTTTGLGHSDQSDRAIPAFKLFFDELEAQMTPGQP